MAVVHVLEVCFLLFLLTATEKINSDCILGCYNKFDNGTSYYGRASSNTIIKLPGDGIKECLNWNDVNSPFLTYRADNNFCHNPDVTQFSQPWCYTNKATFEFRYCNIPICSDCRLSQHDYNYNGKINITVTGKSCKYWSEKRDRYRGLEKNYCRAPSFDPDSAGGPWCFVEGGWERCNVPICNSIQCPPLNGHNMNDLHGPYRHPDCVTVSCKEGYESASNDPVYCTADGTWSRTPKCRGKLCQPLNVPNIKPLQREFRYPANTTVSCIYGYEIDSPDPVFCTTNGTWSRVPKCTGIRCQYLHTTNMNAIQRNYNYPENFSVSCEAGYESVSKDPIYCTANGSWSRTPNCRGKLCQSLNLPNMVPLQREYRYPANITVSCEVGYKIDSTAPVLCSTNGSWSRVPKCKGIRCPSLQASNMIDLQRQYRYPERFSVSCKEGYERVSDDPVYCTADGTWSRFPQCIGIQCNPFPKITHGLNTNATYGYSDLVTIECEPGYRLNTSKPIGCLTNGEWTKPLPVCVEDIADSLPQYGPVIGGAVGGSVALIIIVIVVVIIIRRKKINRKNNESATYNIPIQQENKTQDSVYDEISKKDDTYYNIQNEEDRGDHYAFIEEPQMPKTAVIIDDFYDYVEKRRNKGGEIEAEFETFKNGLQHATTEAIRPGNKAKNKHKNLYPYDDTRVVLKKKTSSSSDYINASFINGYGEIKKYIAAQGPLGNTVHDFWEMIYQFDCGKIVMLTNVLEEGKEKCMVYWPETIGGSATYGSVKVIMTKEEIFSDFTIRTLKLHQEGKEKIIKQFHFTAWPDKDVPKYPSTVVHFRYKVNANKSTLCGPIVVHCSAGIGRTGTYIAVDYVVAEASAVGYVDVYGCVEGLRRQRVNMVQTVKEYTFLHETVLDALSSGPV